MTRFANQGFVNGSPVTLTLYVDGVKRQGTFSYEDSAAFVARLSEGLKTNRNRFAFEFCGARAVFTREDVKEMVAQFRAYTRG
jgi:ferredoxin-thioredoxin reductase catalytic subunit